MSSPSTNTQLKKMQKFAHLGLVRLFSSTYRKITFAHLRKRPTPPANPSPFLISSIRHSHLIRHSRLSSFCPSRSRISPGPTPAATRRPLPRPTRSPPAATAARAAATARPAPKRLLPKRSPTAAPASRPTAEARRSSATLRPTRSARTTRPACSTQSAAAPPAAATTARCTIPTTLPAAAPLLRLLRTNRRDPFRDRYLQLLRRLRVVIKLRQRHPGQPLPNRPLNLPQVALLLLRHKRKRVTRHRRPARPPHPVNVILRNVRTIKVDHMTHRLHINPPRRDIRRHQHPVRPILEPRERRIALRLRPIPVNRRRT